MRNKSFVIVIALILWHSGCMFEETSWCSEVAPSLDFISSVLPQNCDQSANTRQVKLAQSAPFAPRIEIPNVPPDRAWFFSVYFHNECDRCIYAAVRYKDLDDTWVTKGWFKVDPGDDAFVATTRNSIIHMYAESEGPDDERIYWSGNDSQDYIRGSDKQYGFIEKRIGGNFGRYDHRFTCE